MPKNTVAFCRFKLLYAYRPLIALKNNIRLKSKYRNYGILG
jgi:hypothetical protein